MHAGYDDFLCPNPEALVFCGAVPLCQADELDALTMAFLANCAGAEREGAACLPAVVLRSMTCREASELMGEVRDGGR